MKIILYIPTNSLLPLLLSFVETKNKNKIFSLVTKNSYVFCSQQVALYFNSLWNSIDFYKKEFCYLLILFPARFSISNHKNDLYWHKNLKTIELSHRNSIGNSIFEILADFVKKCPPQFVEQCVSDCFAITKSLLLNQLLLLRLFLDKFFYVLVLKQEYSTMSIFNFRAVMCDCEVFSVFSVFGEKKRYKKISMTVILSSTQINLVLVCINV